MNDTQSADTRRSLLEERERIIVELQSHDDDVGPGDNWDLKDIEERATHLTNATVDQQIAEDNRNLLRKVELALQRLHAGTYTTCENCGQTIPHERLLAKPSVSLCLSCQELKDATKR